MNVEQVYDMNFEHNPILLTLSYSIIQNEPEPRLINKLQINRKKTSNYNSKE